jgi:hypothetical protein
MLCIGRQVCLLAAAADGSCIRGERVRRHRRRGQWRIVVSASQGLAASDVRARSGFRRSTAHEFSFARVGEIAQGERCQGPAVTELPGTGEGRVFPPAASPFRSQATANLMREGAW